MSDADPGADGWNESWDEAEPEGIPGDELDVVVSDLYLLYSPRHPNTRWIESDYAVELGTWQ
ncbi:hypothetical protein CHINAEXTREME_17010 [Halobiforma lacisalsi AJ5]|uniref:Uncharacterized protein n=1 Tax=Natronobacterium lacisalsi AJ5 TaxID=358396 RepID=M0LRY7_NATLA|nr:hypothetical protein [Halobiforma lacisalsi]APW99367.1 hypothetical protein CHINAEXTREME_17010 [Halobiforma lacisalsi AJ5]EMA35199.1 hypothetical protein C445_05753 [Halobiforma lacisalsi AJ5]